MFRALDKRNSCLPAVVQVERIEKEITVLNAEGKAAILSNLLTTLVSEHNVQPVLALGGKSARVSCSTRGCCGVVYGSHLDLKPDVSTSGSA